MSVFLPVGFLMHGFSFNAWLLDNQSLKRLRQQQQQHWIPTQLLFEMFEVALQYIDLVIRHMT